jgi:signal transduction histidine kinase/DNA-binding response OmpR family regulator
MLPLRDLPIKRKLMLIILLTSGVVLLLSCAVFVYYDQRSFRDGMRSDLRTLGEMVGASSRAALSGEDADKASEVLATLSAKRAVVAAALYRDDKILGQYVRTGWTAAPLSDPGAECLRSENGMLVLVQKVVFNQEPLGTLFIQYETAEAAARLRTFSSVVLGILLVAVVMVVVISSRLQRLISQPILELAETARVVSDRNNYTIRAAKHGQDEVGFLIDQFNEMLARIERREKELEHLNLQLAESEQKALAATQAKSQFLASMSHELRTPLTAIIGFSEMLLAEAQTGGRQEQAEDLGRINDSAKHLLGLINDILDLSKIEARRMELHLETFEVDNLIRDVTSTIQPLVAQRSNSLEVQCPDNVGSIRADLVKVRQCLFNLLSNANKFSSQSVIQLIVARQTQPQGERILFRVTDTGIGMTEDQMGRLFQAFSQGDRATTRKYGGTGLGLAITKHFCEMMGGSIGVESEPGKGSTFTIELPAEAGRAKPVEAPAAVPPVPARAADHHCVLVIDDDPNVHRLIEMTLRQEGYTLRFASTGKEGLRLAREFKPAVITLDVMMPEMDGWAVLGALKSDPDLANIPVIMLTIVGDRDMGFALGASEYLVKPIDRTQLLTVLRRYLKDAPTRPVLIVDDDAALRQVLRRTLETEKWTVVEATNGVEALQRIEAGIPAVMLLDLIMPVMDGFQVLSEMRRRDAWRKIPVVIITAKDLSEAERRRLAGQTEKVLEKGSYVREELVREVRRCLDHYSST